MSFLGSEAKSFLKFEVRGVRLKHAIIAQIKNTDMLQRIEYLTRREMCYAQHPKGF